MAEPSANLRVRISADVNDIKQGLALLRGQLADVRKQAGEPLPANNVINQLKVSSGQTRQAMAQLPMQFTDIVTSIQGGMPWFTVLVQQGGQIKDSFGGIGPALTGVSTALLGMVNPLSITAVAVAAVALAWKQGNDEGTAFRQAMILVGDSSGRTAERLAEVAAQMDDISGVTTSSAAAALTEVAATGKFTAEQLETVAIAAETMRAGTGKAVSETIAEFAKIKADPVAALLELNETMHFLDQTQLANIKTLVEQGNQIQAVAAAFKIYGDTLKDRASDVQENLGYMERAWRAVKGAASEAWDTMLGVGRQETPTAKIKQLQSHIEGINRGTGVYQGLSDANRTKLVAQFQQQIANLQKEANKKPVKVIMAGIYSEVDSKQEDARTKFQEQGTQYLTKQAQLEERIKDMRTLAAQAGITDTKVLQQRERAMRDTAAAAGAKGAASLATSGRSAGLQAIKDALTTEQAQIDTSTKVLQAQYQARELSAETYYQRMRELTERGTAAEAQSLQKQVDYLKSRNVTGKDAIDVGKQVGEMEAQLAKVRAEGAAKLDVLAADERKLRKQREDALSSYTAALDASTGALREEMDAMVARVGSGDREFEIQQRLNEVYREQAQRLTELALLKRVGTIDEQTAAAEEQAARAATERRVQVIREGYVRMAEAQADWGRGASAAWANYRDGASNAAGAVESATTSALTSFEDMVVKATTNSKVSFRDMANSIIADFARITVRKGISSLLGGVFGGGSGAGTVQREAIPLQGWDTGGYTGPGGKFEKAGFVHKGEGVLSQRDIASIGGPRAFLSMLGAIRSGRGYASGGLVGMAAMPATATGARGYDRVEINNYSGQETRQREERGRAPDGSELRKLIVDVGAADIAGGGRMAGAMKNRFPNLKDGR
ncbi:tail length tape measure protein [Xanthomonas vesicatoria ATCC 35937]|uniref:Lambda phage tail tape-measure protein (Tape meas lam C)./Prophage tail length tape measure protein n=3 Tax=Xanthomonas vesicatoria TaxID=56460 RepID=F0BAP2_9XANT|nr:phage tail length tape measure family protein [Xanthomonas vesicatoria]APP76871.1 tail length tape measure protein [Xanthomonas vesicatoria ATCC 35937]EGD10500.1 Lambda phage tail tape-measure protein (Tape meas lam C)./Prophage tail length tape measure protein [Xanthomonas vesicatoria ATCC 35937]MCC8597962.1 phage tail length tape measure family protein [Xanthomonas vesicatoria]MCC8604830.1 phage tail length tape measure family protein [Xanthomonas vesicatoria]